MPKVSFNKDERAAVVAALDAFSDLADSTKAYRKHAGPAASLLRKMDEAYAPEAKPPKGGLSPRDFVFAVDETLKDRIIWPQNPKGWATMASTINSTPIFKTAEDARELGKVVLPWLKGTMNWAILVNKGAEWLARARIEGDRPRPTTGSTTTPGRPKSLVELMEEWEGDGTEK